MTLPLDFEALALSGWRFWQEDGQLRYRAPKDQAGKDLVQQIRAQRDELQQILSPHPARLALAPLSHGQRALWLLDQLSAIPRSIWLVRGRATRSAAFAEKASGAAARVRRA